MPQPPDWKRVLETGMNFTELRRSQAYRLATELVAQGQLARDQIGAAVDELVEMSRRRSEELRAIVSAEVQRQLSSLGLATQRDLEALERRLRGKATPAKTTGTKAAKSTGAKKAAAKKTPAKKKAAARKAPAKKTAAKKTAAKKTAAKRGTAKRSTIKRSTVKRARKPAGRAR